MLAFLYTESRNTLILASSNNSKLTRDPCAEISSLRLSEAVLSLPIFSQI